MHSAPAVSYPVGRSAMRSTLLILPWLLGGLTCTAWVWVSELPGLFHGLTLLLWLFVAVVALRSLRRPSSGVLRWDGMHWHWETAGFNRMGTVHPALDWQQGLLLKFATAGGRPCWLWLERALAPLYWDALRRAVFSAGGRVAEPDRPSRSEGTA